MPNRMVAKKVHHPELRQPHQEIASNIDIASQAIFDQAQGGIWIVSLDGTTTYANASLAKLLGYSTKEMVGRSLFSFMDEEARRVGIRNIEDRKRGVSNSHKFRLKHKSGKDVWVISSANPFRNSSGLIVGAMSMITEISKLEFDLNISNNSDQLECKNLTLDAKAFDVRVDGKSIELSAFSFKLLQYFLHNTNRVISREEFLKEVWGDAKLDDRVIDVHIVSLRKKLKAFRGEIKTIYGLGYILRIPMDAK